MGTFFNVNTEDKEPGTGKFDIIFTKEEEEKIDNFKQEVNEINEGHILGAIGGNISMEVRFTSIGTTVTIIDSISGREEDIKDLSNA